MRNFVNCDRSTQKKSLFLKLKVNWKLSVYILLNLDGICRTSNKVSGKQFSNNNKKKQEKNELEKQFRKSNIPKEAKEQEIPKLPVSFEKMKKNNYLYIYIVYIQQNLNRKRSVRGDKR